MPEECMIDCRKLTKVFGTATAVNDFTLKVKEGELFGLVGPDGAGKTTVMRLLAAIMEPSSGDASVAGHSIVTEGEAIKAEIGYMSQRFGLYEDLTVLENIFFYADLYDVPIGERPGRIERLLGFSNLAPFKDRLAGNLSGGMKQKLGLACALIHTPKVLFLDEPTLGVDPVSRRDFWKILYDLLREGITIFVSTAYLDEAERCTRIALINNGKILAVDEPAEIKKTFIFPMLEITTEKARKAEERIQRIKGVHSVSTYGERLHVALEDENFIGDFLSALVAEGITVKNSRRITPSLEDAFIAMVMKYG